MQQAMRQARQAREQLYAFQQCCAKLAAGVSICTFVLVKRADEAALYAP
jgi:hypothetical protein